MSKQQFQVLMDSIFRGKANGTVARRLMANGMDVNTLRPYFGKDGRCWVNQMVDGKLSPRLTTNAVLRYEDWLSLDKAVVRAATQRLNGVADLYANGLVFNLNNGMGTTVLAYEDMTDIEDAEMNMDGATRGRNDRPEFSTNYIPLPIISKQFQFNARVLAVSRNGGSPLDTTTAELSASKVAEKVESILFRGTSSYTYGGGTIYGYEDFPYRTTGVLSAAWDAPTTTGKEIVADVLGMKQACIDDRHYGPWTLYIPTAYETKMDEDYSDAKGDNTIRDRIKMIDGVTNVKVADFMSPGSVLLVEMKSETVRMVNGLPVTPVEWSEEGGMIFNFKIITIQVPQIRADANHRCGIVHYTAP